jgi:DNA-directed RNA polymerase subunit RPC12/RpoP
MIDTVLNLLFRCSHRRLTRPVTPVSKAGVPHGATYVVCLDCGKQFAYDFKEMRVGKPLASSHPYGVLKPETAQPRRVLKYAIWAGVPLAFLVGVALKAKKPAPPAGPPQAVAPGAGERENKAGEPENK